MYSNVRLAVQILSSTFANILKEFGPCDAAEQQNLIQWWIHFLIVQMKGTLLNIKKLNLPEALYINRWWTIHLANQRFFRLFFKLEKWNRGEIPQFDSNWKKYNVNCLENLWRVANNNLLIDWLRKIFIGSGSRMCWARTSARMI